MSTKHILSTDSEERKNTPIYAGCVQYFPLALAAVARHSKRGNDKHNPGQPLHWDRYKSMDHLECIQRHLVDEGCYNEELDEYEEACAIAWRALANLQLREEQRLANKQVAVVVPARTAPRKLFRVRGRIATAHMRNGGVCEAVCDVSGQSLTDPLWYKIIYDKLVYKLVYSTDTLAPVHPEIVVWYPSEYAPYKVRLV